MVDAAVSAFAITATATSGRHQSLTIDGATHHSGATRMREHTDMERQDCANRFAICAKKLPRSPLNSLTRPTPGGTDSNLQLVLKRLGSERSGYPACD